MLALPSAELSAAHQQAGGALAAAGGALAAAGGALAAAWWRRKFGLWKLGAEGWEEAWMDAEAHICVIKNSHQPLESMEALRLRNEAAI